MLPYDIIRQISLYCKPKYLSINKELCDMYHDIWFYDKLLLETLGGNLETSGRNLETLGGNLETSGRKLYTPTNYEYLYERYLKQGPIIYFKSPVTANSSEHKLSIKGIKAIYNSGDKSFYILTFNGDLYKESETSIDLIDTQVIDINYFTYIRNKNMLCIYILHENGN